MPDFLSRSIDSGAYMSPLPGSANCAYPLEEALHVREVKREVELPSRDLWRNPMFIRYSHSKLNHLEHVDVTSHSLVVVVGAGLEATYWAGDDTGKLGILNSISMGHSRDKLLAARERPKVSPRIGGEETPTYH